MTASLPWLLNAKVTAPARADGYLPRPALLGGAGAEDAPGLIVVEAPGGFGKTTLLADFCHRQRDRGVLAVWLTLDEDDTPDVLSAYLVHAFERGKLDVGMLHDLRGGAPHPHAVEPRLELLLRAIEGHGAPCLLVLDEVERLADRAAAAAVDFLVRHRPDNLRIALAYRENPGVDVATMLLAGRAVVVTEAELRFSPAEIDRFFGGALSRPDLDRVAAATEGWPAALRIYRNAASGGAFPPADEVLAGDRGVLADYCNARLLRRLRDEDRELLLDLALFDWIDPAVVDEVLERTDSRRRIEALSALAGFMQPMAAGADADALRLHPIVRDYCATLRFREDPDRFRDLHRRIAGAMGTRGRLTSALRHARAAGAAGLAGAILERAGGLQVLLRQGVVAMRAADRFLTPETLAQYPRLALARCFLRVRSGRIDDARALFEETRRATADFTRDREEGDDRALRVDAFIVRAVLAGYGCLPVADPLVPQLLAEAERLAGDPALPPEILGVVGEVSCVAHGQMARFEDGRAAGAAAAEHYARCGSRHGALFVDLHLGGAAMARGRCAEAGRRYARARRTAAEVFARDMSPALYGDVLSAELALERNDTAAIDDRLLQGFPARLRDLGAWFDVFAAGYGVAAELTAVRHGADAALAFLDERREEVRSWGFTDLARYVAALRVSTLAAAGRPEPAARAWRDGGLPERDAGVLDLDGQRWREMEAAAEARIRLLAAAGEPEAARGLADRLCDAAGRRGLVRTRMRGLAAGAAAARRAGDAAGAAARMTAFLRAARETDYPRPLVRERGAGAAVLRELLEADVAPDLRAAAEALRAHVEAPDAAPAAPELSARERDVLTGMARGERARETAARLGVTEDGVRYHVKALYRKLGAGGRQDAVRRARELGVLPRESAPRNGADAAPVSSPAGAATRPRP